MWCTSVEVLVIFSVLTSYFVYYVDISQHTAFGKHSWLYVIQLLFGQYPSVVLIIVTSSWSLF